MSEKEERTVADSNVLTKYTLTAEVVNRILKRLVSTCVNGACIRTLCEQGDTMLAEELAKTYKKEKDLKKGIAFPVCISVNNCINHFSPLANEPNADTSLKTGDLVKIDLGAHMDGFIAVVAHSLVIGATQQNKCTGRAADAILAAHQAAEAVLHLFTSGTENCTITRAISKVVECYDCRPVEGMLSFQLQQNRIDGEKLIQASTGGGQRKDVDKCILKEHEVYAMDVIVSTGKGQGKEMDTKVTIFKKTDETYQLKLKCSREFIKKVNKEHGQMAFNLRNFEDPKKARMGVVECVSHKLVTPYPVVWEKPGELVAQFKYTVMVMPNGPAKITGLNFDTNCYKSDVKIESDEVKALLAATADLRKKKKEKGSDSNKTAPATAQEKKGSDSNKAATHAAAAPEKKGSDSNKIAAPAAAAVPEPASA